MGGLIMAAQLILALSIIVSLHEFGHFIAARAFGIKVEKFYLFFDAWGVKLFKFKKGDTEYGIGWLPLGGYVKIAGMIDESMDKEAMKLPPKDYEFRSKPAWQRLIVMLGGVIMNFILGIILLSFVTLHYEQEYLPTSSIDNGIYAYDLGTEIGFKTGDKIIAVDGKPIDRFNDAVSQNNMMGATITVLRNGEEVNILIPDDFYKNYTKKSKPLFINAHNFDFSIDSILPQSIAAESGLERGDKILTIDSIQIHSYGDFKRYISSNAGKTINMIALRNNDTLNIQVAVDSSGVIGVHNSIPYDLQKYSVKEGLKYGWNDGISILKTNIKGFGKLLSGKEKATESLQGPISIATIYGPVWNWHRFWFLTAMISLILAFMNLLPIPALDGGHVLFLSVEAISRRKIPESFLEKAQMVGMVLLLALMVFVIGNDFWKLIFK